MMRKMESKDMDRLNQVTFERDNYKKECEDKILIIKDLHRQLQNSDQVRRYRVCVTKTCRLCKLGISAYF